MIQRLSYDFQHAVRFLSRRRLFTLGAVLVLAIGIGPLTSVFTLMNAVLFRPWQVPNPDSVAVIRARPAGSEVYGSISIAEYRYLRQYSKTIAHMAAAISSSAVIDDRDGRDLPVMTAFVNADYFQALGIKMMAGRGFLAADEDYDEPSAVAIISDRLWRDRFGRDPSSIGAQIGVAGVSYQIIGVAGRGFAGIERTGPSGTDLWLPLPARALGSKGPPNLARLSDPRGYALRILAGRLSPAVTRDAVAAELSVLSTQFRTVASLPSNGFDAIDTRPLSQAPPGSLQSVMPVYVPLLCAVSFVLLVSCANVGNLVLAETLAREREIAIRLSLGSSRARVVSQLLIESALVSVLAAVVGLGLAFVVPYAMISVGFTFGPTGFVRTTGAFASRPSFYAPDLQVWLFAMLLACVTTALAVLAPAMRVGRIGLASLAGARHGRTARRARVRRVLLASQIAVTMVLLIGATTLTRATVHATSLNPGFRMKDIQVVSIQAGPAVAAQQARSKAFFLDLLRNLDTASLGPVAFTEQLPFSDVRTMMMARRPDESPSTSRLILLRPVSQNYFTVLNIPIVRGRAASDTDSHELVLNQAAVRILWPDVDPIGQTLLSAISQTEFDSYQVVGVAKDVPVRSMSEIEAVIYRAPSWTSATSHLLVRGLSPTVVEPVRSIASSLESSVTVTVRPFSDFMGDSLSTAVLAGRGAWAIGLLGLVLAIVGSFGVFAHEVEERRYEIGIRRAVGASGRAVTTLLLRTASVALLWGIAAGFVLSLLTVPLLQHFLYGLSPFDPIAYAQVGGILAAATALATWVPTRRAMSVDPARTLRGD